MALVLRSVGSNWGGDTGGSRSYDIGTGNAEYSTADFAWGVGSREIPHNDGRGTNQWCWATPVVTAYRNRDNSIVITSIKLKNIRFEYRDNGIPPGTRLWGSKGDFYVRSSAGGWHWDWIYNWTSGYYTNSLASYVQGLSPSTRTVWTGSNTIPAGGSWNNIDLAQFVSNGGEVSQHRNSVLNISNTYTKPNPTPPTLSPSCYANTSNGNTLVMSAGGSWGYCENQNNSGTYAIYDNEAMTTPIKSGNGTGGTFSGFSPNTRYWASFTKSNGCFSRSATCSAVTVTPNSLSEPNPQRFDTTTIRLAVTNGGGEYKPTTDIYVRKCGASEWTKKATSTTTSVETVTVGDLIEETCYEAQARTTTTAGTYIGNTIQFTTPKKGICIAEFTKIEPGMNEKTYEATVDMCYKWETIKVPATIVVRYQVKDGYDKTWYETEPFVTNELTGEHCFTIGDLYPNQTIYQTYIHTETEEATYDSPMSEFVTAVIPEPDIHNCENFEYLTELLCQSVKKLYHGNKTIYANPYSQAMCDPYNEDPTMLTLWSRALRLFHAMYCLVCDMGGARLTASKPGQYLVGEAGWQDIITIIDENAESENWRLATSDAIWKYIQEKLHEVWHYHGNVDVLVYDLADLDKFPDATSAILTSENAIYRKVSGVWKKSTDKADQIDDMGVWHIKFESSTKAGYVQPGSAWYQWQGNWQPLDADVIAFAKIVDAIWEKKDQAIYNESGADRLHVDMKDRLQFNCADYSNDERTVVFITEPLVVPAPGYYEVAFETGDQATLVQTQQVLSGALAQQPEDPTRPGYIFDGWNDKATGAAYDWTMPVTKNIMVQAQWIPQPVTVTFDIGAAEGTPPSPINTVYGATINPLPDDENFSLAGATFLGWQRDGVPFSITTQLVGDTVLKPRWSMDEFDVTVHFENGEPDQAIRLTYGTGLSPLPAPTKTDSIFVGWFTSPMAGTGAEFGFNTPLFGATDVYARWVPASYTLTFDSAGGSAVPPQTVAYQGFATQPATPTKSGNVFVWWMYDSKQFDFNATQITQDITLTAKWSTLVTVKFVDSFGDTLAPNQTVVAGFALASPPPDPTRAGYTFSYWAKPNGEAFDVVTGRVETDMTLTAIFTQNT